MAFGVRFSTESRGKSAIYLDQQFYEMIVSRCLGDESGYVVLKRIAALKYKSPTFHLGDRELLDLCAELKMLLLVESHPQISDFMLQCQVAVERECTISVYGDMYPELT